MVPWAGRRVNAMPSSGNIDTTYTMLRVVHLMCLSVCLFYSLSSLAEFVAGPMLLPERIGGAARDLRRGDLQGG